MKLSAFLLAALAACALEVTAPLPYVDDRAKAIRQPKPPLEWLAGYAQAEICSGIRGDIRKIEWYLVPGSTFRFGDSGPLFGYADGRRIYIAESMKRHPWLARHEALHTLGYGGHDSTLFQARCKADWPFPSDTL